MEKMIGFSKKVGLLDISAIALVILTVFKFSLSVSSSFLSLGFDSQNLIAWKFAQNIGLFPYKDVFYPYGLLNYFVGSNILISGIYIFVIFLLFIFTLNLFKRIFQVSYLSFFFFGLFYFLIVFFIGIDSFVRYGVVVIFALFVALQYFGDKFPSLGKVLIQGFITGTVFSLFLDQGVYIFIICFVFIFLNPLIKDGAKELRVWNYYKQTVKTLSVYLSGVFIGSVFLFIFLAFNGLTEYFFNSMKQMSDLFLYAKTPYLHSLKSFPPAFNFIILFITISYLSVRHILFKIKLNEGSYIFFTLVISLVILEQKSIVRSIDSQILFISFIIVFVFINIFLNSKYFRKFRIKNSYVFMLSVFFYLSLIVFVFANNLPGTKFLGTFETFDKTLALFKENNDLKKYYLVLEKIKEDERWNQKIFTYPSDPIFYILNNQKPPFYFTNYESSPLYAQNIIINYIRENKIEYVIYNLKNESVQDGVPNYIRTPLLHEYIFNNFSPLVQIGDFVILSGQPR